jgi:molybdopterin-containing oxidoreductase family iron-sulfur binding subunit
MNIKGKEEEESLWDPDMTRRSFLKLMGAQIVMLSMAGCVKPLENIVPYARSPEEIVPGKPLYFASAVSLGGFARGVLVESNMGRPTKIEGNPEHPDSLGATDAATQAVIFQLYDPDRSNSVTRNGTASSWQEFAEVFSEKLKQLKTDGGQGLRILSQPVISPTLAFMRKQVLEMFPNSKWHQYSALNRDMQREALLQLYDKDVQPILRIKNADVIFSIESDFLTQGPGAMAYAREFSDRREVGSDKINLNRLYALESNPTLTGAAADHRIICRPAEIEDFVTALLEMIEKGTSDRAAMLSDNMKRRLTAAARELADNKSRSLVVAGREQSVFIQQAACRLNDALQNTGKTIDYIPNIEEAPEKTSASLQALIEDLGEKKVSDLVILDGNPVYASPRGLDFGKMCRNAGTVVYLGPYEDETSELANWHIPMAHELESWGDVKAFDGTVTIRQPLINPLYNGITEYELCMLLLGKNTDRYEELIRGYWKDRLNIADFENFWHNTLHDGVMAGSALSPLDVKREGIGDEPKNIASEIIWTLLIRPDPHILDGRFSNNSWLQELPKPLIKLTWENAALINPESAAQKGLTDGTVIEISAHGAAVEAPVLLLPAQAPDTVTVFLGYGRKQAGVIGDGLGFDAYKLQTLNEPYQTVDFNFTIKGEYHPLAITQTHAYEDGRDLVLVSDIQSYKKNPSFVGQIIRPAKESETLYNPKLHLKSEYQWGMSIDLNRCTGCGACTMACQVENNGTVVGKKEILRGRKMHWIRVDRYYKGSGNEPEIYHQPVPCMHCENAPCELVCPVEATTHSAEGINEMSYNRCVGTRYCSNNCPYKVRRFNFFEYNDLGAPIRLGRNPNVTVRSRGVMEKCTYCIQRVNRARITAQKEQRKVLDGEIVPACQQACPARAIVFGNVRDPKSEVSQKKSSSLSYGILTELGTRPRTTYIAKIKNPSGSLLGA